MTDPNIPAPPPMPDPTRVAQWAGQIRAIMPLIGGVLGAFGIAIPTLSDAQLSGYISAAMILIGLGMYAWSAYTSWQAKNADRKVLVASTVASVQHGTPVVVTVTPEGQPNVATKVSATEQATAPSVPVGVAPLPAPPGP